MDITKILESQRAFFNTKTTLPFSFRVNALKKLKSEIIKRQNEIAYALNKDLGKSFAESYMCEIGMVLSEINFALKHLKKWIKPKKVKTPLAHSFSKSFIMAEPLGVVLIMSPWNYPFMLCLDPLVGAIASGNCAVIKPSNYSFNTSKVIRDIISTIFEPTYVTVVEGGREQNQALLDQKFDYIFFTGGLNVGTEVAGRASKNLIPYTLELGGKSPCIIEGSANLKVSASRVAFGKFLNCGQTCVAPDYLLIDDKVKDKFIAYLKEAIVKMFTENPLKNKDYGKIINKKHFDRLSGLIDKSKVIFGGNTDETSLKIEPTLLDNITLDDAVMKEEIFGPILPIITYNNFEEAEGIIKKLNSPLAFYVFSNNKKFIDYTLKTFHFGGGCINDTIIHLANPRLSFGGVGTSGMGKYHGYKSFETFSNFKSLVKKYNFLDLPIRYAPYTKTKQKLIKFFMK